MKIFLERIQWKPSIVVAVDDQSKHAESVTHVLSQMGIDSYAFVYTAAEHAGSNLNEEQSLFQIRHLIEHETWLPDDESRK